MTKFPQTIIGNMNNIIANVYGNISETVLKDEIVSCAILVHINED